MKYLYIFLSALLLISSCSRKSNGSLGESVVLGESEKVISDSLLFNYQTMVKLEDNPNGLIHHIDKIIEHEGMFIILDKRAKQILFFDKQGRFLSKIYDVGSGYGEYVQLCDVTIDYKENKIVLLVDPFKLLFYNLNGEFEKELFLGENYLSFFMDEKFIYLRKITYANNNLSDYSIRIIDRMSGEEHEILPPLPEIAPFCYSREPYFFATENLLLFTRKFDNVIYQIAGTEITPFREIDFGANNFPTDFKKERFDCVELNTLCLKNNYIYSVSDVKITDSYLIFRTNIHGLYVLNRARNELNRYQFVRSDENDFILPNFIPVVGNNDLVSFVFYPAYDRYSLEKYKNGIPKTDFGKIVQEMDEESNPLLMIYSVK